MLSLNALITRQPQAAEDFFQQIKHEKLIYPAPLSGRIALLQWVFHGQDDIFFQAGDTFRKEIDFFSIDIIPYLLVHNHIPLLSKWMKRYKQELLKRRNWVSFSLKKMYLEAMDYVGIPYDDYPDEGLHLNKYLLSSSNLYQRMKQKIQQQSKSTAGHV